MNSNEQKEKTAICPHCNEEISLVATGHGEVFECHTVSAELCTGSGEIYSPGQVQPSL